MGSAHSNQPVGLLQSGGLSGLAVGVWLAGQSVPTRHYVADLGQSARSEIELLADSVRRSGAEVTIVDLRKRMAEVASDLLRYYARHDGGYWNTTGAARFVLVEQLAPILLADGCRTLAHGCVGGGNDERRFARYTAQRAPELAVYSPWADPAALARFPDRAAMLKSVMEHGLRLDAGSDADRSTDANLAGVSHESRELEDLRIPVDGPDSRWRRWAAEAQAPPETIIVAFENGRIVDVDSSGPEPLAWMSRCNEVGARHGIWLRDVVERRIIGTVCRGMYEAPGLELLEVAWSKILQASLDGERHRLYGQLAAVAGVTMYEARWTEPIAVAARTAIDTLVADVSGSITLVIHRGAVTVAGIDVASQLVQQTRFGTGGNRWSQPVPA